MRKPMTARPSVRRLGLLAAVVSLLSACNADTSIKPAAAVKTPEATAPLAPMSADKALYGVVDGVYAVTFDPTRDNTFYLGNHRLSIPGYSVCNLLTSGYGAAYWNRTCTPQTLPVTLTVTIKGAQTDSPQVDFLPAMRFSPSKTVQLFMYVPNATQADATNWRMLYCPTSIDLGCIDESLTDPSLGSFVDRNAQLVFRRVKHFSGYVIAGGRDEDPPSIDGQ
jgi:hypothetical protein